MEWSPVDYYRLSVENRGRRAALGCRVQIVGLTFVQHGVWRHYENWEPITLIWSHRPQEPEATISPSETAFCDVGHVFSNLFQSNRIRPTQHRVLGDRHVDGRPARFFLDGRGMPNNQPSALASGDYHFICKLLSADYATQEFGLRLASMGQFASILRSIPEGTRFETVVRVPEDKTLYKPE